MLSCRYETAAEPAHEAIRGSVRPDDGLYTRMTSSSHTAKIGIVSRSMTQDEELSHSLSRRSVVSFWLSASMLFFSLHEGRADGFCHIASHTHSSFSPSLVFLAPSGCAIIRTVRRHLISSFLSRAPAHLTHSAAAVGTHLQLSLRLSPICTYPPSRLALP
jgi:hypothetical protein